ncbi:MAG TPA: HAMP domain-containing sensor histidine kinase [Campylobacterales bacterium]|nr:HAMP domain-containing sensor histidine kinase [Campylobacterales bacterium]
MGISFFIGKLEQLNKTLEQKVESEVKKRIESEEILIQQNKMATMGEMIGAISHQWKQPLNSLGLMTQDVKYAYEYGELNKEYIETFNKKATEQIQYMAKTIDDFRNFFKPNKEKKQFCITMALQNAAKLLETQLKNNSIELIFENIDIKIFGFGNQNEFSQAIINILNNAKDVLIEKTGSDKTLKASIKIAVERKQDKVSIKISDNGGGIKKEILDNIFEPYTTSKESGTGIGLYMAKMIIKDGFNGELTASNDTDGAVFEILIDEFIEN